MIKLTREGTLNYVAVYPDSASIYASNASGRYEIDWVSDYDKSSGSIDGITLVNTPTVTDPRLVLQISSSDVPEYTGNYTVTLQEYVSAPALTWVEAAVTFGAADFQWSSGGELNKRTIDVERAWVSGSDVPSFNQYAGSPSQGQYSTYHLNE